eukprot:5087150-Amphidinium_carterae.1
MAHVAAVSAVSNARGKRTRDHRKGAAERHSPWLTNGSSAKPRRPAAAASAGLGCAGNSQGVSLC